MNASRLNNMTLIVVAIDREGGYAKDHKIPWHYPEDLAHFQLITKDSICIMGKNTYLDINEKVGEAGKESVLPGRTCFVVSTTLESVPNATVVKSVNDVYTKLEPSMIRDKPIIFLGGSRIFEEAIHLVDGVIVTVIDDVHDCDTFFPTDILNKLFTHHRRKPQTLTDKEGNINPKLRVVIYERR